MKKKFLILSIKIFNLSRYLVILPFLMKDFFFKDKGKIKLYATHLGLGDQILSLPLYLELAKSNSPLHLVTSEAAKKFFEKLASDLPFFYHVIARPTSEFSKPFYFSLRKFAKVNNFNLQYMGWEKLRILKFLYPYKSEVEIIYLMAGVDIKILNEFDIHKLNQSIENFQVETPRQPYALVDSYPGTLREIPESVFQGIQNRNLLIVNNPRDIPFDSLLDLVKEASELHLTNSSLLCFSLLVKSNASSKNIYLMREGLYHGFNLYDSSWVEWALNDDKKPFFNGPNKINRKAIYDEQFKKSTKIGRRIVRSLFRFV